MSSVYSISRSRTARGILSVGFGPLLPIPAQFGAGDLHSGDINNIQGRRGTEMGE